MVQHLTGIQSAAQSTKPQCNGFKESQRKELSNKVKLVQYAQRTGPAMRGLKQVDLSFRESIVAIALEMVKPSPI